MGLLKPVFKGLTSLAVASAMAGVALANDDATTPVTNASVSTTVPQQAVFTQLDDRSRSIAFVEADAAQVSADKPVVVVWGGSTQAMKNAYIATKELNDAGMDIGFILAPNRQTGEYQYDVEIQIYAGGGHAFNADGVMQYGGARIDEIGEDVKYKVRAAQSLHFPQQTAQLNLK